MTAMPAPRHACGECKLYFFVSSPLQRRPIASR
jgi:hypothetical protein